VGFRMAGKFFSHSRHAVDPTRTKVLVSAMHGYFSVGVVTTGAFEDEFDDWVHFRQVDREVGFALHREVVDFPSPAANRCRVEDLFLSGSQSRTRRFTHPAGGLSPFSIRRISSLRSDRRSSPPPSSLPFRRSRPRGSDRVESRNDSSLR